MEETIKNHSTKPQAKEARNAPLPRQGRRVGAAFIDLLLFVGLSAVAWVGITTPIMNKTVDLAARKSAYVQDEINSYLYDVTYYDDAGSELTDPTSDQIAAAKSQTLAAISESDYAQGVFNYYTIYKYDRAMDINNTDPIRAAANQAIREGMGTEFLEDPSAWYISNILKADDTTSYFTTTAPTTTGEGDNTSSETTSDSSAVSSETSSAESSETSGDTSSETTTTTDTFLPAGVYVKDGTSDDDLSTFYSDIYTSASTDFQKEPDHYQTTLYTTLDLFLATSISSLIIYLLFPLVFKNGATLGKKILGLGVVNTYGYKAKWWQHVIRYFVLFFFEIILSFMYTSFILTFVSFTMLMFGKKQRALHDFAAGTRPVDLRTARIYASPEEEDELDPLPVNRDSGDTTDEEHEKAVHEFFADRAEKIDAGNKENIIDAEVVDSDQQNKLPPLEGKKPSDDSGNSDK